MEWFGAQWPHIPAISDNPLKWFMRAYVATQYGDEVEDSMPIEFIPEPVAEIVLAPGAQGNHYRFQEEGLGLSLSVAAQAQLIPPKDGSEDA